MRHALLILLLHVTCYCIGQADPNLKHEDIRKIYGDNSFDLNATSDSPAPITYVITSNATNCITLSNHTVSILGAGSAKVKASQVSTAGYAEAEVTFTITINKRFLYVAAVDTSRVYGEENPAFDLVFENFAYDDNISDLIPMPLGQSDADRNSSVGDYDIYITTQPHVNYLYLTNKGTLTVTKRILEAKADSVTRAYGDPNPDFTITYTGWVNNDNISHLDQLPMTACDASEKSPCGEYTIEVSGGSDNNYQINAGNGIMTVVKRVLQVRAVDVSRVYGNENPAVFSFHYENFASGENELVLESRPVANCTATASTDAGNYSITVSGGSDENYDFQYVYGTLTIMKRQIEAVPQDVVKVYGAAFPGTDVEFLGLMEWDNQEDINVIPVADYDDSVVTIQSDAGFYEDAVGLTAGVDNNYTFHYQTADLTITKANLTISATLVVKEYGDSLQLGHMELIGLMEWDDPDDIDEPPQITCDGLAPEVPVGVYDVIFTSNGDDNNYNIYPLDGKLRIDEAPLQVTVNPIIVEYGDSIPDVEYLVTGLKMDHALSDVFDSLPSFSMEATPGDIAGTYDIAMVFGGSLANQNYSIDPQGYNIGYLRIEKAPFPIRIRTLNRLINQVNPELKFDYDSGYFKLADNLDTLVFSKTLVVDCNEDSSCGAYEIYFENGTVDPRYLIDLTPGFLRIFPELDVGDSLNHTSCLYQQIELFFPTEGANLQYNWFMKGPADTGFHQLFPDSLGITGINEKVLVIDSTTAYMGEIWFQCEVTSSFYVDSIAMDMMISDREVSRSVQIQMLDTPPYSDVRLKGEHILVCVNNALISSFQWGYGNFDISGATGQYYLSPQAFDRDSLGLYYVKSYYDNGCYSKSHYGMEDVINIPVASSQLVLDAWPNPSSDGSFRFSVDSLIPKVRTYVVVQRYDGMIVLMDDFYPTGSHHENRIDLPDSRMGFYFLNVIQGNQRTVFKLIVTE